MIEMQRFAARRSTLLHRVNRALLVGCIAGCGALLFAACRREPPRKLDIVHAPPSGEIASYVRSELLRAAREDRSVLVYVGASWCEPCQRFHHAAESGQLDARLPRLRLIDFDLDRDRDRLQAAGYSSRLIPLFALPGADGRASGKQIEGSIKGEGAVTEIAPRLEALVSGS